MKIAVYNGNVMAFKYQSTNCEEIEVDVPKEWIDEPMFVCNANRFYVENGEVKRRSDEEINLLPEYIAYKENEKKSAYVNETDGIILKAVRELLKDNTFRSKLSSDTQQLLANAEIRIAQIKSEVK
jgi:hypothetical protein